MQARIPLASTASVYYHPGQEPTSPWSDLSREAFDHFALTERLPEQEYFWISEWQEAEREADEDIKAGRTRRFSNAEELIADLDSPEY